MIGLDTSLLVRYLVGSPPDQAARSTTLIDGDQQLGISVIALLETAHVLRTQYGIDRSAVVDTLIELVTRANVTTLELSKADVLGALVIARTYPSSPIGDALIAAASHAFGAVPIATFDRDFARLGTEVIEP